MPLTSNLQGLLCHADKNKWRVIMETTDVGLASYIYLLGKDVEICRLDPRHCVFRFEECPEIAKWQKGQAMVNVLTFLNACRALLRRVKGNVKDKAVRY